jgi:hypothetical protein
MRFDPATEQPDPINGPLSITMGLLVANDFTLKRGVNTLKLKGAMINPETFPGLNNGTGVYLPAELVRERMSVFVTNFLKSQTMSIGIVGYSSLDEFAARSSWPTSPNPEPSPFPGHGGVDWLSKGLTGLRHVVAYTHPSNRTVELQTVVLDKMNFKLRELYPCQPVVAGTVSATMSVPFPFMLQVDAVQQQFEVHQYVSCSLPPNF